MNQKLVLHGSMKIWSQEGGYASPDVEVNGEPITGVIAEFVGQEHVNSGTIVPGIWRVTVERIDRI